MEKIIQEIKSIDIIHIIQQYIELKRTGANYVTNCPFHDENTGSLVVSSSKGIFKCFGCGEGGDAIEFVRKFKNFGFLEAVQEICNTHKLEFNIKKEKRTKKEQDKFILSQNLLTKVQDLHRKKRDKVEDYLNGRGIEDMDIIDVYGIGIAHPGMYNILDKEEYTIGHELSILTVKDNKAYDFLNNRLSYPIRSQNGTILGIAGRTLMRDEVAKYINPRDSFLYNKSKVLYGLYEAQIEIRKKNEVVITEGAVDVWTAYAHGIKNAVATNGTALTPDHAAMLSGYTKTAILAFDNDNAGNDAASRAFMILAAAGFTNIKIAELDEGSDLSDFLISKNEKRRRNIA